MTILKFSLFLIFLVQPLYGLAQVEEQADTTVDGVAQGFDTEQSALQASIQLEQYQLEIARIEGDYGPYDATLIEAFTNLGSYYQHLDQHAEAATVFDQALHIARISSGLVSESQLLILKQLVTSNKNIKDWESVDKYHHLSYHIQSRLYSPDDKKFADAVVSFGDWKLAAYRENLLGKSSSARIGEVEDLNKIYDLALQKIEQHDAQLSQSTLPVLYGKAITEYEISNYLIQLPYRYYEGLVREYFAETVCRNVTNSRGQVVRSCYNVRRINPAYRDSQRQQKQFTVQRSIGHMEDSVEKAQLILATNTDHVFTESENTKKVHELEELYAQLVKRSRSRRFR